MPKFNIALKTVFLCCSLTTFAQNASAQIFGFPNRCAYASDRQPLPGHILRLGFVAMTSRGPAFFFPDRDSENLQKVDIADNVGIIGRHLVGDFSNIFRARTPRGQFLVAHIFVGTPDQEPIVTCFSRLIPVSSYVPIRYGTDWRWLDRDKLGYWLGRKKFSKWNWKKRWESHVFGVRAKFKGFRDFDRRNKFVHKDTDNNRDRDANPRLKALKKLRDGINGDGGRESDNKKEDQESRRFRGGRD